MRKRLRLLVLLPLLLAAGCGDLFGPAPGPRPAIQLDEQLVHAYTQFGIDLFGRLAAEAPDENLFLSPTSAAFALAMTYNGAAAATRDAMANALGIDRMDLEQANRANRQWLETLRETGDPRVELALANSIWAKQGFPFHASFLDRNREFYDAEVTELPFNDAAVTRINSWVKQNTRGKINRILDEITADDVMFLINALYFKGAWRYRFDEAQTRIEDFTRPDGSRVRVPLMNQRADLPYLREDRFQLVSLPYGNGRFSMVLVLPDHGRTLSDFRARLTPAAWEGWLGQLKQQEVGVLLPRFKIEWEKSLNDVLSDMGMEIAFTGGLADFTEMSPAGRRLYISLVQQRTFIEVNEEGTEAAAVTAVGVTAICAGCGPQYPILRFDRPFFFAIQDHATGTLLFLGQVVDPS